MMECEFQSTISDPLHNYMIEGMLVIESKGLIFTHCSHEIKYWPLKEVRNNLKNLEDKSKHLFREDGRSIPKRAFTKGSLSILDPLPKITRLQFYEAKNLLFIAFREDYLVILKVYLGSQKGKYRKRRGLTFKPIKYLKTKCNLGFANIKVSENLLLLGELDEKFKIMDLRTGRIEVESREPMQDWVTGLCACMGNKYLIFSSTFGSLCIYEQTEKGGLFKRPEFKQLKFFNRFDQNGIKNTTGINCIESSNRPNDPILIIGARKEARFAEVFLILIDVRTQQTIHQFKDSQTLGLFTSIQSLIHPPSHGQAEEISLDEGRRKYSIVTKNQDHEPGQQTVLMLELEVIFEQKSDQSQLMQNLIRKVTDSGSRRIKTNGTGANQSTLFAQILTSKVNDTRSLRNRVEILNTGRSKTLHHIEYEI